MSSVFFSILATLDISSSSGCLILVFLLVSCSALFGSTIGGVSECSRAICGGEDG